MCRRFKGQREGVLSIHHVDPEDYQTQVIKLSSKYYLLSHVKGPVYFYIVKNYRNLKNLANKQFEEPGIVVLPYL